jgi:hypothetical protein
MIIDNEGTVTQIEDTKIKASAVENINPQAWIFPPTRVCVV